ncbi:MAG: L-threonine 3-dehydrogenase [Waddliaceae bacterium]
MDSIIKKYPEKGLWWEDTPIPSIQDNEVLIKVRKTSICGTDLHILNWDSWARKNVPVPLVIGHEFVGEIAKIGKHVKGLNVGGRVSGEGHLTCGLCPNCRKGRKHLCLNTQGIGYHKPGCFSEYFALPGENVFLMPEEIEDNIAAIFDPYGNAVHTALTFDLTGRDVLITGAGPIGLMGAAVAKKAGARHVVITDVNPYRLELAKKMGATAAVNVRQTSLQEALNELGIEQGFSSVGMEMSGNPEAFSSLLQVSQPGSRIALLGILPPDTVIDWDLIIFKMLTIKGIWGREIFSTWYKMISLLESGLDLHPIVTHEYPAKKFQEAFELVESGQCGKVILNWE